MNFGSGTVTRVVAAAAFSSGHIPRTVSIPLDKSFSTWAGWLLPYTGEFYLLVEDPCPHCLDEAVRAIQNGTSTDVQEMDAASRTGVDDVRDIIESVRYAAAPGKWRVFIVDEVHMLSTAAFNALLKTLEEPPSASSFILVSSMPDSLLPTVQSRCPRLRFGALSAGEVADALIREHEYDEADARAAASLAPTATLRGDGNTERGQNNDGEEQVSGVSHKAPEQDLFDDSRCRRGYLRPTAVSTLTSTIAPTKMNANMPTTMEITTLVCSTSSGSMGCGATRYPSVSSAPTGRPYM